MADLAKNNNDRKKLLDLYHINSPQELALEELNCRGDNEDIENFVFNRLIELNEPVLDVVKKSKKKFGLSTLAASYICRQLQEASVNSTDIRTEFIASLNDTKRKITVLSEFYEKAVADGDAATENIPALFAEIREWTKVKNQLISEGIKNNLLAAKIEKTKSVDGESLSELSDDELMKLLGDTK